MTDGPLQGVRILDVTSVIMGPYATQILADYGADVITVESPEAGGNRFMGPGPHKQFSGIALNLLRNKRNISLDLKDPAGRAALLRVAGTCDIFITNLRPAPLERLRLSYRDLQEVRADLIYCRAQGFPGDSQRANDPAYDDIIQSASGLSDAGRRTTGEPSVAPTILADKVCALVIVNAVLAALFHRSRTGEGQQVEVPMVDAMRSFVLVEHGAGAISEPPVGPAGYRRVLNAFRGPQRTSDGWIHILPYSARNFDAIFAHAGREDLVGHERTRGRGVIDNAGWLYQELRPLIAERTTKDWLEFCEANGVPYSEIADLDELVHLLPLVDHPVAGAYHHIPSPVRFSSFTELALRPAALLGADGAEVLAEVGYDEESIAELVDRRILRLPRAAAS